ncbi:MAG: FmdB family zinc ribbon protein [Candidatus Thorarchaeota archaeon]|jgi:putative FmdB family regulatory protein
MATYEFKCHECQIIFEEEHSMADAPSTSTCDCGKEMKRYYGGLNFVLKGDGWPSKNIRNGKAATANNTFEADQIERKKRGQKTYDKEIPMSDEEYKRRRKNIERFIDETPKK